MLGLMQDVPLTTTSILDRARRYFGAKEVVTRTATGIERSSIADVVAESARLAGALDGLGLSPDARVGTFAWNTARHLAL